MIPCFNDGATIGETIASLEPAEPVELVVVDDGSDDPATLATLAELESGGTRVLRQANAGPGAARMTGVAATTAPYVFPLDADDLAAPGGLTALADALDAHPEHAAVWGATQVFGSVSIVVPHARLDPWRITYFNGLPYSSLFRRDSLLEANGWAADVGYEDWNLWMSLAERGASGLRLPVVGCRYRVHGVRRWSGDMKNHELIFAELQRRHPSLFERRWQNWRRSTEPWWIKLFLPMVDGIPRLSYRNKRRLYNLLADPRNAGRLVERRLRRLLP